ncbi:MAG: hypothetical protein RSE36_01685 [Oscillospiraceae bacterium]
MEYYPGPTPPVSTEDKDKLIKELQEKVGVLTKELSQEKALVDSTKTALVVAEKKIESAQKVLA